MWKPSQKSRAILLYRTAAAISHPDCVTKAKELPHLLNIVYLYYRVVGRILKINGNSTAYTEQYDQYLNTIPASVMHTEFFDPPLTITEILPAPNLNLKGDANWTTFVEIVPEK